MIFPDISTIQIKRQKLGIKQKELAQLSRVSQSLIAKLEKRRLEPSYSVARRIFLVLENIEHKKEKKCSEIMSKKIIYTKESDKIKKASEIMKKYSISQIPVLSSKRIIGSITESAIFNKILEGLSKKELFEMKIKDILEEPFPIVRGNFPISVILPLLKTSNAVLITEKQKTIGIITKADLL